MFKFIFSVVFLLSFILTTFVYNEVSNDFVTGEAVQLLKFVNGKPELDDKTLTKVFQNDKIKGKPTIIISMVGDQGTGKSFLLNWCLRYLSYCENKNDRPSKFLFDTKSEFTGFKWGNKAIQDGTTEGIIIWSRPFILNLEDNSEVALFIMDTQGSHDVLTDTINNAVVFSLSTFISSIQIHNINKKPKSYDYKHLAQFTNHGSKILEAGGYSEKSFQKLIFLIRDWSNPNSYAFGVNGGERYKNEVLFSPNENNEFKMYTNQIKNSFTSINCFLMPYPGDNIAEARDSGDIKNIEMNIKFYNQARNFMGWLFGLENINYAFTKKVNEISLHPEDIPIYFKAYFEEIMKVNGDFKSIDDFDNANVRASNQAALNKAFEYYQAGMNKKMGWTSRWFGTELAKLHNECKDNAIEVFDKCQKLGDFATNSNYEIQLKDQINNYYQHISEIQSAEINSDFKFIAGAVTGSVAYVIFKLPVMAARTFLGI